MNDEYDSHDDNLSEFGHADDLASQWLDDGLPVDADQVHPLDQQRFADLAFLSALLERVHMPDPRNNEERVQRVMASIVDQNESNLTELARPAVVHARVFRAQRWLFSSVSAAAILVALFAFYWTDPTRTAHAAVHRALVNATSLQDRQYRVTTEVRISSNHSMSFESFLTVRGGEKFTLRHPAMLGQAWLGSNGEETWVVPAMGQPRRESDPKLAIEWAKKHGIGLPEMHISALIEFLQQQFDLELMPSEKLPGEDDTRWQRLRGERRQSDKDKPQLVELWANPKTGVARKILLDWDRQGADLGLTRITVDLVSEDHVPDSWYEAASHQPLPVLPIPPIMPVVGP
jgi:hypothetical protein